MGGDRHLVSDFPDLLGKFPSGCDHQHKRPLGLVGVAELVHGGDDPLRHVPVTAESVSNGEGAEQLAVRTHDVRHVSSAAHINANK